MTAEFEHSEIKKGKKHISFTAKTIAAVGIAFAHSQIADELNLHFVSNSQEPSKTFQLNEGEIVRQKNSLTVIETEKSPLKIKTVENGNEKFKKIFENTNVRLLLGSALVFSLASTAYAYKLGGKYEERKLQILRTSGPLFLAASLAAMEIGSFTQIDRHIAVSLFTASTFLTAGYNVISTFERERNIKTRALAVTTSSALTAVGLLALNAVNKI